MANFSTEEIFLNFKTDYLFYLSRILNRVMVAPEMIQIMLTAKCNIRCKICDVWKQRFGNELTTEEVKDLIDQAINIGVKTIYFTGGEALLRKDIFELIDYAARSGIVTTFNTNGSIITKDLAERIVLSKLRNITFSIDSSFPKIHNSIRGKNVFEKAIEAVGFINYYKKKFCRESKDGAEKRLDVGMVSVIMKPNIGEFLELVNLAFRLQCCYIAFQPLVYNGNLLDNHDFNSDYWINEGDMVKLKNSFKELDKVKNEMAQKGIHIDFMADKIIDHFMRSRTVNTCFAGFSRIFVNPQGDVSFVCFEAFGNIRNISLKEAWLSPKAYSIRAKIKECKINCTQFCSERAESEDFDKIHGRLQQQISDLLKTENSFLNEMKKIITVDIAQGGGKFMNELQKIEEILSSVEKKD